MRQRSTSCYISLHLLAFLPTTSKCLLHDFLATEIYSLERPDSIIRGSTTMASITSSTYAGAESVLVVIGAHTAAFVVGCNAFSSAVTNRIATSSTGAVLSFAGHGVGRWLSWSCCALGVDVLLLVQTIVLRSEIWMPASTQEDNS